MRLYARQLRHGCMVVLCLRVNVKDCVSVCACALLFVYARVFSHVVENVGTSCWKFSDVYTR